MTIQEMIEFLEIEGFTVPWNGTEIRAAKDGTVTTHYRGKPASQGRGRYGRMEFTETWTSGRPATSEEIATLTSSLEEEVQRRQGAVGYTVNPRTGKKHFLETWEQVQYLRDYEDVFLLQPELTAEPAPAPKPAPVFDAFEEECDPGDYDEEPAAKTPTKEPKKVILNITQHTATPDQLAAGVVDLPEDRRRVLQKALTFEELPSRSDLEERADCVVGIVTDYCQKQKISKSSAMIGGAPFFMPILAETLRENGILPLYAFSQRIVEEQEDGAGGVRKVAIFRHVGFVSG